MESTETTETSTGPQPTSVKIRPDLQPRLRAYCEREERSMAYAINKALDQMLPPVEQG